MSGDSEPSRVPRMGGGPILLFGLALMLGLLCLGLVDNRRMGRESTVFPSDSAYADLAVARRIASHGAWEIAPGQPVPATAGSLWRIVLAAIQPLAAGGASAVLAGGAAALLGLFALFAAARALPNGTRVAGWGALSAALGTSLAVHALSGTAAPLAAACLLVAWALHTRACAWGDTPLSLGAALLVGLAAANHIECAVAWPAMALHGALVALAGRDRIATLIATLLRTASGFLLIGVCLLPLLFWNLGLAGVAVPWPRFPDAPLSLNALSAEGVRGTSYGSLASQAMTLAFARLLDSPVARSPLAWILVVAGLAACARGRAAVASATALLASLALPAFFALGYPLYGASALDVVLIVPQGAMCLLAVMGCMATADAVGVRVGGRATLVLAIALVLFVLSLVPGQRAVAAGAREALARAVAKRASIDEALGGSAGEVVASTEIGWLAWSRGVRMVDLGGVHSPDALLLRSADGSWDIPALADRLRARGATRLVAWDRAEETLLAAAGCRSAEVFPAVCVLNPTPRGDP